MKKVSDKQQLVSNILKNATICVGIYFLIAALSVLSAQIFSVNNGKAGIYFSAFQSQTEKEVQKKFLESQSFLLKPPFVFSYSLPLIVDSNTVLKSYEEKPEAFSEETISQYKKKINDQGSCMLGGEYGSWEVWVYAYTFFGYPYKVILTCNSGLQ